MAKEFLTTSQAARLLSVSPDTVLKWVKAGKIKSRRTLGGHFRIPASELQLTPVTDTLDLGQSDDHIQPEHYQYCWQYLARGGKIMPQCRECITFRSRATRCYELKDLPAGLGCLNLMCDTECSECEYYKLVGDDKTNILILSENQRIIRNADGRDEFNGFQIQFADSEYEAAAKIQSFRPDYVIVDCAFGKKRTGSICGNLFNDIRIPVVRIILSSKTRNIGDYCDREVFGWIRKPFDLEQLKECIYGVPKFLE